MVSNILIQGSNSSQLLGSQSTLVRALGAADASLFSGWGVRI